METALPSTQNPDSESALIGEISHLFPEIFANPQGSLSKQDFELIFDENQNNNTPAIEATKEDQLQSIEQIVEKEEGKTIQNDPKPETPSNVFIIPMPDNEKVKKQKIETEINANSLRAPKNTMSVGSPKNSHSKQASMNSPRQTKMQNEKLEKIGKAPISQAKEELIRRPSSSAALGRPQKIDLLSKKDEKKAPRKKEKQEKFSKMEEKTPKSSVVEIEEKTPKSSVVEIEENKSNSAVVVEDKSKSDPINFSEIEVNLPTQPNDEKKENNPKIEETTSTSSEIIPKIEENTPAPSIVSESSSKDNNIVTNIGVGAGIAQILSKLAAPEDIKIPNQPTTSEIDQNVKIILSPDTTSPAKQSKRINFQIIPVQAPQDLPPPENTSPQEHGAEPPFSPPEVGIESNISNNNISNTSNSNNIINNNEHQDNQDVNEEINEQEGQDETETETIDISVRKKRKEQLAHLRKSMIMALEEIDENPENLDKHFSNIKDNPKDSDETQQKIGTRYSVNKMGVVLYKGHKSYGLMKSVQVGVRKMVETIHERRIRPLVDSDYSLLVKIKFDENPEETMTKFEFKDYCPMVFRQIRRVFGIKPKPYLDSICDKNSLAMLGTPGKSGALFFFSQDGRFVLKTVTKKESKYFRIILPGYYQHVLNNKDTLLPRFYGLHRITPKGGKNVRFIVMNNVFQTSLKIHEKYDLKGSTLGRKASEKDLAKECPIFKDLDITQPITLAPPIALKLVTQIERDCEFLKTWHVMDYSLLFGVHYLKGQSKKKEISKAKTNTNANNAPKIDQKEIERSDASAGNSGGGFQVQDNSAFANSNLEFPNVNGENQPSFVNTSPVLQTQQLLDVENKEIKEETWYEGILSPDQKKVYFFGIIDILQEYNTRKFLERTFKALSNKKEAISVADPKFYAKRFFSFMAKNFVPAPPTTTDASSIVSPQTSVVKPQS